MKIVSDVQHEPKPAKLAHLVLRTKDRYKEMVEWYEFVLNASKTVESPWMTFLTYDDEHHRVAIAHFPDAPLPTRGAVGMDHIAFTYASLKDLMRTWERLKQEGIEPFCPVNHGPTTSLYYADPDGNRVELQIDNFENMEDAVKYMQSEAAQVNPVGVMFDPKSFLEQLLNGTSERDVVMKSLEVVAPPSEDLVHRLMTY